MKKSITIFGLLRENGVTSVKGRLPEEYHQNPVDLPGSLEVILLHFNIYFYARIFVSLVRNCFMLNCNFSFFFLV